MSVMQDGAAGGITENRTFDELSVCEMRSLSPNRMIGATVHGAFRRN